ncbi:hypothetical protein OIO90_003994 [Microbotryomycetes sp. JL221]|nr:hypothetical protein OIO90_003994 [Microbotryomycetes sp. JL221]
MSSAGDEAGKPSQPIPFVERRRRLSPRATASARDSERDKLLQLEQPPPPPLTSSSSLASDQDVKSEDPDFVPPVEEPDDDVERVGHTFMMRSKPIKPSTRATLALFDCAKSGSIQRVDALYDLLDHRKTALDFIGINKEIVSWNALPPDPVGRTSNQARHIPVFNTIYAFDPVEFDKEANVKQDNRPWSMYLAWFCYDHTPQQFLQLLQHSLLLFNTSQWPTHDQIWNSLELQRGSEITPNKRNRSSSMSTVVRSHDTDWMNPHFPIVLADFRYARGRYIQPGHARWQTDRLMTSLSSAVSMFEKEAMVHVVVYTRTKGSTTNVIFKWSCPGLGGNKTMVLRDSTLRPDSKHKHQYLGFSSMMAYLNSSKNHQIVGGLKQNSEGTVELVTTHFGSISFDPTRVPASRILQIKQTCSAYQEFIGSKSHQTGHWAMLKVTDADGVHWVLEKTRALESDMVKPLNIISSASATTRLASDPTHSRVHDSPSPAPRHAVSQPRLGAQRSLISTPSKSRSQPSTPLSYKFVSSLHHHVRPQSPIESKSEIDSARPNISSSPGKGRTVATRRHVLGQTDFNSKNQQDSGSEAQVDKLHQVTSA